MAMRVEFLSVCDAPGGLAHNDFTARLRARAASLRGGRICDIGGGAHPALELDFLAEHELDCLVVDISRDELDKAPDGYAKLVGDAGAPGFAAGESAGVYDLVFSRVTAEHVRDPRAFHANVHGLLRPGGLAMHFFPTLWWPPFIVNRVLPEAITERILLRLQPYRAAAGKTGKFPAYYRWCRGPTMAQVGRFASAGFAVQECVAYFGERGHAPGPILGTLNCAWGRVMADHPVPALTTYATYTLRALEA